MKLQQNQVWQQEGGQRLRIVHLERLSVEYMVLDEGATAARLRIPHVTVTKKEFCRLIKGAELLPGTEGPKEQPVAE